MQIKPAQKGFSLIEIMLVLVMIAVMMALTASFMSGSLEQAKVRAISKDLVSALKYTRGQAVIKHEQKTIVFNVKNRTYRAPKKKLVQLPDDMEMNLYTAESDIIDEATGKIRFFSDGSSTGGWVKLTYKSKIWKININWLTGEVRIEEGGSD
jgi:general secretion pathway protein H